MLPPSPLLRYHANFTTASVAAIFDALLTSTRTNGPPTLPPYPMKPRPAASEHHGGRSKVWRPHRHSPPRRDHVRKRLHSVPAGHIRTSSGALPADMADAVLCVPTRHDQLAPTADRMRTVPLRGHRLCRQGCDTRLARLLPTGRLQPDALPVHHGSARLPRWHDRRAAELQPGLFRPPLRPMLPWRADHAAMDGSTTTDGAALWGNRSASGLDAATLAASTRMASSAPPAPSTRAPPRSQSAPSSASAFYGAGTMRGRSRVSHRSPPWSKCWQASWWRAHWVRRAG